MCLLENVKLRVARILVLLALLKNIGLCGIMSIGSRTKPTDHCCLQGI